MAAAWTADGGYTDPPPEGGPPADVRGHEAIVAVITAAHEQFPGFTFRPTGVVEGHHDIARFAWEPVARDGSAPVAGSDVVTLDEEGRIRHVLGLLDRVPTTA